MKAFSFSLIALVLSLATGGMAHAQAFDGPSVGVQGGWSESKLCNPTTDLGVTAIDASKDAATIGGFVGYDKTFGKVVVGAEAGMSVSTKDTVRDEAGLTHIAIDPKWSIDVSARAGYLLTPQTLVYARAGYTGSRIRTTLNTGAISTQLAENRNGVLLGAGVERAILPHLSARLEYRYSDLSEGDGKFDRHQTLFGVTYRF